MWVGKRLPILEHIDIGKQLGQGNWLVVLYHHDCPDCRIAIPTYEEMARRFRANGRSLRIALIEIPPYGSRRLGEESACVYGRLSSCKQWFTMTPVGVLTVRGRVESVWVVDMPDLLNYSTTSNAKAASVL
jgi:thiol-disulfide isomerase/thioredoxin